MGVFIKLLSLLIEEHRMSEERVLVII